MSRFLPFIGRQYEGQYLRDKGDYVSIPEKIYGHPRFCNTDFDL